MAKLPTGTAERTSPIIRARDFFQEVNIEMRKVAWPSVEELKQSTQVVLLLLAILGTIVFAYDLVFKFVIIQFLRLVG